MAEKIYDVNNLPEFFTGKMRAAARRLSKTGEAVTLKAIGREMQDLDLYDIPDRERAFLSCVLTGGDLCGVAESDFLLPKHKTLFAALRNLGKIGVLLPWEDNTPVVTAYLEAAGVLRAAGGGDYIRSLFDVCGMPGWAGVWAVGLREFKNE